LEERQIKFFQVDDDNKIFFGNKGLGFFKNDPGKEELYKLLNCLFQYKSLVWQGYYIHTASLSNIRLLTCSFYCCLFHKVRKIALFRFALFCAIKNYIQQQSLRKN